MTTRFRNLFLFSSLTFGLALAPVSSGRAALLTVVNSSFETPVQANDGAFVTAPGASGASGSYNGFGFFETMAGNGNFQDFGIENPSGGEYAGATGAGTPAGGNGTNVAFLNQSFAGGVTNIFQDVGALSARTTYTLTIAVGQRIDRTNGALQIALINAASGNANPFGTGTILVSSTVGGGASATGGFTDYSVTFTTGNTVTNDLYLGAQYTGDGNIQASLDNIRLNAVPEPSTVLAMFAGIGLMIGLRRLRRAQIS